MQKSTLAILAAAGFGFWYITKMSRKSTAPGAYSLNNGGAVNVPRYTTSVFNTTPITPPNAQAGWQYFSDGSATGPDGAKYSNGYF